MDAELLKSVGQVSGIGGIALGVLLLVFRDVIRKNIFPKLTKEQAYKLLRFIILLTFLVALAGIGAWVWVISDSGPSNITVRTANDLRQEFSRATELRTPPLDESDFRHVRDLITTLVQLDPRNGHALYYSGEMKRWLGKITEARKDFYGYLESEPQQPNAIAEDDISAEVCYRSAAGYCRQRSGWICHLLASDFYKMGLAASSSDQARFYFKHAINYAQKAQTFFPGGFEQEPNTQKMERESQERIKAMDNAAKSST